MALARRGTAKMLHEQRVAWLTDRPGLYEGVPGIRDDVTEEGRARLEILRAHLVEHGMMTRGTRELQRETVRRLVSELRGESVMDTKW